MREAETRSGDARLRLPEHRTEPISISDFLRGRSHRDNHQGEPCSVRSRRFFMQQTAVTAEERMFQAECCVSAPWKEKEYVMRPNPSEKEVRERAKQLWEQHGKPENREEEFWRTAERELLGLQDRGEDMKGSQDNHN